MLYTVPLSNTLRDSLFIYLKNLYFVEEYIFMIFSRVSFWLAVRFFYICSLKMRHWAIFRCSTAIRWRSNPLRFNWQLLKQFSGLQTAPGTVKLSEKILGKIFRISKSLVKNRTI